LTREPLWATGATRNERNAKFSGRAAHLHLIRDALIMPAWSFSLKKLRYGERMISIRPGNAARVGLVEYSQLQQPEGQPGQRYADAIAASLHSPASKRGDGANGSKPGSDIVVDHEHLGQLRALCRSFESQNASNRSGDLVKAYTICPGST
jgi:hypothetical protein